MSRFDHLLGYVRGQLAVGPRVKRYTIVPAVTRLIKLSYHLRDRRPAPNRTLDLAAETLADIAWFLAGDAGLGDDEIFDLFRSAVDRPDEPRSPDPPAARADLSVAMDHLVDLGWAVQQLAPGGYQTERPLIDHAAGAVDRILAAVQKMPAPGGRVH